MHTSERISTEDDLEIEVRHDHLYKIVIIGDSGVGKTSILNKYLKGTFLNSPLPTIATEFATKIIQIKEGGYIKAQIWDTAGQEKYKSITSHHYKKSVGALIVYDITKRSSYNNVPTWSKDLHELAEKGCIIALVGNKLDLVDKDPRLREISREEAEIFARENKMLFFETSAYNSSNINEAFEELLQTIYTERRKIPFIREKERDTVSLKTVDKNKSQGGGCCDFV